MTGSQQARVLDLEAPALKQIAVTKPTVVGAALRLHLIQQGTGEITDQQKALACGSAHLWKAHREEIEALASVFASNTFTVKDMAAMLEGDA